LRAFDFRFCVLHPGNWSIPMPAELNQRTTLRVMSALGGCGHWPRKRAFGF
jgi:hypothetical protein